MKKLLATFAIAAAAAIPAPTSAAELPTLFNVLCINRTDGVTDHLKLDAEMTITMTSEGVIRMVHPKITVEYPSDQVSHFAFADTENPDLYDGDHEASISTPALPDREILISGNEIRVSGNDGLTLYDLRGVEITRVEAADGSASIAIGGIPAGVYILRIGSTAVKIKI